MARARFTVVSLALLSLLASSAAAFDITGTWTGVRKCKDLAAGAKLSFKEPFTATITQTGNAIGISFDFGFSTQTYAGLSNFLPAKPDKGEFAMIHCGTNEIVGDSGFFDAIGRMQASTKPDKIKAKIKGITLFSDPSTSTPTLGTCKWTATRTIDTDPGLTTACPVQ